MISFIESSLQTYFLSLNISYVMCLMLKYESVLEVY